MVPKHRLRLEVRSLADSRPEAPREDDDFHRFSVDKESSAGGFPDFFQ
jgi:hypothetical protein